MYRGRYENRTGAVASGSKKQGRGRRKLNKLFLVTLSVFLMVGIVAGGTLAYLVAKSERVENNFIAASVSCRVDEDFTVTNTSNVDAYLRAAVVVNWMDDNGDIRGIAPKAGTDYTLRIGDNWKKIGDYYYYTTDVAPGTTTETVVCSAKLIE